MDTLAKKWWLVLLNGILFMILGFYAIMNPVAALVTAALYVGIIALASGVITIYIAFSSSPHTGWGWRIFEGVVDLIFGIVLLSNPMLSAAMIPVLIGIWIFVRGLTYLSTAWSWRGKSTQNRGGYIAIGVLMLCIGFFMTIDWTYTMVPVAYLIGVAMIFIGFAGIVSSVGLRKMGKNYKKTVDLV